MKHVLPAMLVGSFLLTTKPVIAQCQMANPSFELLGNGKIFGGWNQFGTVWSTFDATTHGLRAARLAGPDTGNWDISAYWQRLDSTSGDQWSVIVDVGHRSDDPLTGELRAIINFEWRDADNELISFESHTVADASTPADIMQRAEVLSGPAPSGTVATHVLLAILQSPAQEAGSVIYDLIEVEELTSGGLAAVQWDDFPGGREVDFSGRAWRVKGPGFYGPGPNDFSDDPGNVWVDGNNQLHMTVLQDGPTWSSTEVALIEPLGYGDYRFTCKGRLDTLAPNTVLGLFLWQYSICYDPANPWNLTNEIDAEISRWNDPDEPDVSQFVTQPYDFPGNIQRFPTSFTSDDQLTTFAFRWLPDRVEYRAWLGGPDDENQSTLIQEWTYDGPHIPRPEQPRVHINLWQIEGAPTNGLEQEVVITSFEFEPVAGPASIPTVSQWGVLVTLLLILAAGTTLFRQRVAA